MPDIKGFYSAPDERKAPLRPLRKHFSGDEMPAGARVEHLLNSLGAAYYEHWRAGESMPFRFKHDGRAWDVLDSLAATRAQFNRLQGAIYHWQELRRIAEREKRKPLDERDERDVPWIERKAIAQAFFEAHPDIEID